ncbi:mitogen-activated protein kinase [Striga asiatica]|uniref:Mitogen-activated protein kinase n=1 Tax=Striga asiatica TaxID=4170 RepID=A0A5A7NZC0_STRAF|nr:mitogen-activated protein kinase [Striga asiatica]
MWGLWDSVPVGQKRDHFSVIKHLQHENVIALKDVMLPNHKGSFMDVYLVYKLMDTDLHQIIKSSQTLTNDYCQYFLFQADLDSFLWSHRMARLMEPSKLIHQ